MNVRKDLRERLEQIDGCTVREEEPMHRYTSFKTGGPADLFVEPISAEALQHILRVVSAANVPYFILGKGSNLLVGDLGIRGVVIKTTGLNEIRISGTRISAGAGVTLAKLANAALDANLTGLEFASGIPGTLGGAVVMNAGAYDGEMKNVLSGVTALTPAGERKEISNAEAEFTYRHSIFLENGWIVVEAEMELQLGDPAAIREKMNDLNCRRKDKQPLEYPSAGSTFKRPPGYFAGALIDQSGLRGYRIGDAQVSEKHCGFVINRGNATAQDILRLIQYVQDQVKEKHGVDLEPEIRLVGEFSRTE